MNFQLKGFKMKTFQFLLGLVILVAVLWTVTTPANAEADSMIGGWVLIGRCPTGCDGAHEEPCTNGPPWTVPYCDPGSWTWVCSDNSSGWGTCTPMGYDDCDSGGYNCPGDETGCS